MTFWIVKARAKRTDLSTIQRGQAQRWRTKRPPRGWKPTDGVLLWQAAPHLELRGIGTIVDIPDRDDDTAYFDIHYDSDAFAGPNIAALRKLSALRDASFLKPGAAGTVFPLTNAQARAIAKHLPIDTTAWRKNVEAADQPEMAISIRQPYTELILRGIKTTEFRSQPTKRRGRVYIYAANTPGPEAVWTEHHLEPGTLPTGQVVGTIDIMTCVKLSQRRYGYRLSNPKRIRPMTPRGHPQPVWFKPF